MLDLEVCRVCLADKLRMYPIEHTRYKEIFDWYTEDTLDLNEDLPHTVCFLCKAVLNNLYEFLENMINTEIYLKELVRSEPKLTLQCVKNLRQFIRKPHNLSKVWLRNSNFIAIDTYKGNRPPKALRKYFDTPPMMIEYHLPFDHVRLEDIHEMRQPRAVEADSPKWEPVNEELDVDIDAESPDDNNILETENKVLIKDVKSEDLGKDDADDDDDFEIVAVDDLVHTEHVDIDDKFDISEMEIKIENDDEYNEEIIEGAKKDIKKEELRVSDNNIAINPNSPTTKSPLHTEDTYKKEIIGEKLTEEANKNKPEKYHNPYLQFIEERIPFVDLTSELNVAEKQEKPKKEGEDDLLEEEISILCEEVSLPISPDHETDKNHKYYNPYIDIIDRQIPVTVIAGQPKSEQQNPEQDKPKHEKYTYPYLELTEERTPEEIKPQNSERETTKREQCYLLEFTEPVTEIPKPHKNHEQKTGHRRKTYHNPYVDVFEERTHTQNPSQIKIQIHTPAVKQKSTEEISQYYVIPGSDESATVSKIERHRPSGIKTTKNSKKSKGVDITIKYKRSYVDIIKELVPVDNAKQAIEIQKRLEHSGAIRPKRKQSDNVAIKDIKRRKTIEQVNPRHRKTYQRAAILRRKEAKVRNRKSLANKRDTDHPVIKLNIIPEQAEDEERSDPPVNHALPEHIEANENLDFPYIQIRHKQKPVEDITLENTFEIPENLRNWGSSNSKSLPKDTKTYQIDKETTKQAINSNQPIYVKAKTVPLSKTEEQLLGKSLEPLDKTPEPIETEKLPELNKNNGFWHVVEHSRRNQTCSLEPKEKDRQTKSQHLKTKEQTESDILEDNLLEFREDETWHDNDDIISNQVDNALKILDDTLTQAVITQVKQKVPILLTSQETYTLKDKTLYTSENITKEQDTLEVYTLQDKLATQTDQGCNEESEGGLKISKVYTLEDDSFIEQENISTDQDADVTDYEDADVTDYEDSIHADQEESIQEDQEDVIQKDQEESIQEDQEDNIQADQEDSLMTDQDAIGDGNVNIKIECVEEELLEDENSNDGIASDLETWYNEVEETVDANNADLIQTNDIKIEFEPTLIQNIDQETSDNEPYLEEQYINESTRNSDGECSTNDDTEGNSESEERMIHDLRQITLMPTVQLERLPIELINKVSKKPAYQRDEDLIIRHESVHDMTKKITCDEYSGFNTEGYLARHKTMVHDYIRCQICEETVKSDSYPTHLQTHPRKNKSTCNFCGKIFKFQGHFLSHLERHKTNSQRFQCTECMKKFTIKHTFLVHLRKHIGTGPFTCILCNASYEGRISCYRHIATHATDFINKMEFACFMCSMIFDKERDLMEHAVSHIL